MSFEHNTARKNLFLSACFCCDRSLSLQKRDQKFKYGGTIGYADLHVELIFCQFDVLRLHAMLENAAGAVRAHSGKGLDYCYIIEREPNSSLLGHVTGLLYCFNVKFFCLPFSDLSTLEPVYPTLY